jgi:hypothetical protein
MNRLAINLQFLKRNVANDRGLLIVIDWISAALYHDGGVVVYRHNPLEADSRSVKNTIPNWFLRGNPFKRLPEMIVKR